MPKGMALTSFSSSSESSCCLGVHVAHLLAHVLNCLNPVRVDKRANRRRYPRNRDDTAVDETAYSCACVGPMRISDSRFDGRIHRLQCGIRPTPSPVSIDNLMIMVQQADDKDKPKVFVPKNDKQVAFGSS